MGLVTHRAIVTNLDMGPHVLPLSSADSTIAFLPSAHIAQRVVVELLPARDGACVWFSESLSKLPLEMRAIKPTFFLAPPRVWERVYSSITVEIRKRPAPMRRLFYFGVGLGSEAARLRQHGKPVPKWMRSALRFFDRVMFAKIRERLGGRIRVAASGAAPLGKDLAEFYAAIGMPLIEGYGLTEGGVAALNPLDRPKPGSIGKLLPGWKLASKTTASCCCEAPACSPDISATRPPPLPCCATVGSPPATSRRWMRRVTSTSPAARRN